MLTLLSPAKKLNIGQHGLTNSTLPVFVDEATQLIHTLKKYSPKKLRKLMKLSDALAELNVARYANWEVDHTKNTIPAALMFNGEVYAGLDAHSFSQQEQETAQTKLRILSGLYGVLKPLDLIHPYRLEMGTKLKVGRRNDLYAFWGDKIVNELNSALTNHNEKVLINLASNEYFKAVNSKKLEAKIITPTFKDFSNGQYKTVMVYAKKARGMMARFILANDINKTSELMAFDSDGYSYNKAASTTETLVFHRG